MDDELLDRIRLRATDPSTRTSLLYDIALNSSLPAKATALQIARAEDELGFKLPADLSALYLNIANGGFGPGCGIIGLEGGWTDDQGASLVSLI